MTANMRRRDDPHRGLNGSQSSANSSTPPVRPYSSGMVMRLGFSVAIHADPVCFIVDEALAVGDARFQQKCRKRIKEFRDRGGSILYVSHELLGP